MAVGQSQIESWNKSYYLRMQRVTIEHRKRLDSASYYWTQKKMRFSELLLNTEKMRISELLLNTEKD